MAAKKAKPKGAPKTTRRRKGVKLRPTQLTAVQLAEVDRQGKLAQLAERVLADEGSVLAQYREPLGGHELLLVALPLERVEPTPFQRDVSDAHVRRLTRAMDKTKRFLDPIIVTAVDGKYWTPNGNHRLTALRELGAKSIVAILVPEPEVAYHILALNIEKAHALRERALEVVRMYRELGKLSRQTESVYELEFEEPALVTLGFAYEQRPRLAGGAYHAVLRKVDSWIAAPLPSAAEERERRAALVVELDEAVNEAVARLKAKGLTSPYLKNFVVSRVNPLRFIKGDPPPLDVLLPGMAKRARGMKTDKIKNEDLARTAGPPPDED
ncbi:MAG TPA: ParB N-terminal domain-containing protein [Polyangiaceae bacterium]|nr:ParB N-terminal domain-containing protein [Polyangiaceae bacterium]